MLERTRRALAEIDGAIADARRSGRADDDVVAIGYGPFGGSVRVSGSLRRTRSSSRVLSISLEEEVTPDSLRRVGGPRARGRCRDGDCRAAARTAWGPRSMRSEMSRSWRRCPSRILMLSRRAFRSAAFASECILLPREPPGQMFNAWLRASFRIHNVEFDRTMTTASAPWDRRMSHVRSGEAVSVVVADWVESMPHVVTVPFDPPLIFPMDLASRWPPNAAVDAVVRVAQRVRDRGGWLTQRAARTELPDGD